MYASTEHKQPRCNGKHISEKKPSGHWDTFNRLEHHLDVNLFVCPCIASTIANDDQKDATILVYLFIPNQLYVPSHPRHQPAAM